MNINLIQIQKQSANGNEKGINWEGKVTDLSAIGVRL